MVGHAGGGPSGPAASEQYLLSRRPGPEFLRECRLDIRLARSAVAGAARLWQRALHERCGSAAQDRHRGLRARARGACPLMAVASILAENSPQALRIAVWLADL